MNAYAIPGILTLGQKTQASAAAQLSFFYHPDEVVERVKRTWGVTEEMLKQPTRGKERVAEARQTCMYFMVKNLKMHPANAAGYFGRQRVTANHAIKTIEALYETDKLFRSRFLMLINP